MASTQDKQQIMRHLAEVQTGLIGLETRLRLQNRVKDANEISKKFKAVQKEVDKLLQKMIDEWLGASHELITEIGEANAKLQTAIKKIKKKLDVAKNVVKVIGLVDEVIGFAKKVL